MISLSKALRTTCFASAAVLALAPASFAQDDRSGVNFDAGAATALGPVGYTNAALTLAEFGRAQDDPRLLIAAARTLQMIGESAPDGEIGVDAPDFMPTKPLSEQSDTATVTTNPAPEITVESLLTEARFLARGDAAILAEVALVEGAATRGSTTGAGWYRDNRVLAREIEVIRESYSGGEIAEVSITGDGGTDVDLYIMDENENIICEAESTSDREMCSWTPVWTGDFLIVLRNLGPVSNTVDVHTN